MSWSSSTTAKTSRVSAGRGSEACGAPVALGGLVMAEMCGVFPGTISEAPAAVQTQVLSAASVCQPPGVFVNMLLLLLAEVVTVSCCRSVKWDGSEMTLGGVGTSEGCLI